MSETATAAGDDVPRLSAATVFSYVVVGISIFPLGLFLFSQLGRHFFLAELIGNFRAQIMAILLPFPILLLILRRWKWGLVLAITVAWSIIGVVQVYLPGHQAPEGPNRIKILSINVLAMNSNQSPTLQLIDDEDPDIITILEYASRWTEVLSQLDEEYPYQVLEPRWHGFGIAVFSKLPLENTIVHQLAGKITDSPCIITRAQIGNQIIRIVGLHVLSPTNPLRLEIRNKQLAEVSTILNESDEPTIVMGDFNCTPWSPFLSDVLKATGYRDTRQGFGYQPSWPADYWPIRVPIDHAFVSDEICIHDRYMAGKTGSDHLPLVVEASVSDIGIER